MHFSDIPVRNIKKFQIFKLKIDFSRSLLMAVVFQGKTQPFLTYVVDARRIYERRLPIMW